MRSQIATGLKVNKLNKLNKVNDCHQILKSLPR